MNDISKIGHIYIPAHIMERSDLSLTQKVLFGKIVGLSQRDGYCTASNEWLAKQIGLSGGGVSNAVSKFVRIGVLKRSLEHNDKLETVGRKLTPWIGINPRIDRGIHPRIDGIQEILDPRDKSIPINPTKEILSKEKEIKPWRTKNYLLNLPPEDIEEFVKKFPKLSSEEIIHQASKCYHNNESKGITRKNYKSTLINWLDNANEWKKDEQAPFTIIRK